MDPSNKNGLVNPEGNRLGRSEENTFGSLATCIGASAYGLITKSLLIPDPHTVGSSLASLAGGGSKGGSSTASTILPGPSSSRGYLWREGEVLQLWEHGFNGSTAPSDPLSSIEYSSKEGRFSPPWELHGSSEDASTIPAGTGSSDECLWRNNASHSLGYGFPQSIEDYLFPDSQQSRLQPVAQTAQSSPKPTHPWLTSCKTSNLGCVDKARIQQKITLPRFDTQADGAAVVTLLADPAFSPGLDIDYLSPSWMVLSVSESRDFIRRVRMNQHVDEPSEPPTANPSSAVEEPSQVNAGEETQLDIAARFQAESIWLPTWLETYDRYQEDVWAPPAAGEFSVHKMKRAEGKSDREIVKKKNPAIGRLAMVLRHFNHVPIRSERDQPLKLR